MIYSLKQKMPFTKKDLPNIIESMVFKVEIIEDYIRQDLHITATVLKPVQIKSNRSKGGEENE